MRQLTPAELLSLREMLQMEGNALAVAKNTKMMITDNDLKALSDSSVQVMEGRVKGLQQFILENEILSSEGVH